MNTQIFATTGAVSHLPNGRSGRTPVSGPRAALAVSLLLFVLVSGCKNDAGGLLVDCDTTPPLVGSISPACGSTGVAVNQVLTVNFNEDMESSTVTNSTFTLTGPDGRPITGSVTYVAATGIASFTPSERLASFTNYTYTIKGGSSGVADLFENVLSSDFNCIFTTGATPDESAPVVTSTDPAINATGVSLNYVVTATFSEAMDPLTITASSFTLHGPGSTPISGTVTYAGPSTSGVFTPSAALAAGTVYTATITTGAADLVGNSLASDYTWSFTTGSAPDITRPRVIATDPANGATLVPADKTVSAQFSEEMASSTITASSFTLHSGTTQVPGSVSYAGVTAVFVPTATLLPSTTYTATITTGAQDRAGNALVADHVWIFTTAASLDATAPRVIATQPTDGATGVGITETVRATFNESMNPASLTMTSFTLRQGSTSVLGTVSYSGMTATFDPTVDLAPGTEYTATITTGAVDLAGNPLTSDFVWRFTTAAATGSSGPMAVNLTCAAGYAILAGATITSTGPSIVNGDVAMSPGSALTGFPPGTINGTIHINDTTADNAKGCLTAAYNDAAGRAPGTAVSGNIGGLTLAPGVYTAGSGLAISSGDLTLDAKGNANGVFIFQIPTSLTVTAGRHVILAGGAQAKNVFWQVGSSATIGTTAIMMGTIMSDQAITLETGATLNGAALARIAAVTLDAATINVQ